MSSTYTPTRRANKIADWLEITAASRATPCPRHTLLELGDQHGFGEPDIALGVNTVRRRHAILGAAYPFRTAGGGIAASPGAADMPWTALLLMSAQSPVRAGLDIAQAAAHLERITAAALACLYGPGTRAIRFAWPSEDRRTPEFPDAVRWLAGEMNVPVGGAYRPPYRKDGGVDVVAWRPFPDGRSGFPVLLVQCTLEREYAHKVADIDLRVWSGWLCLDADPGTALAVPEVVPSGEEWNALAARTVVLDRTRLSGLAAQSEHSARLAPVRAWTSDIVAELARKE